MSNLDIQLKSIQDKLQLLLKQHQAVIKENKQLQKELQQLKEKIAIKDAQTNKVQQQLDARLINENSFINEDEKKEMTKRITSYLAEINQCLSLINTA